MLVKYPIWLYTTFHFVCSHCGKTDDSDRILLRIDLPFYPNLPDGWQTVNNQLICDAHEIVFETPAMQKEADVRTSTA